MTASFSAIETSSPSAAVGTLLALGCARLTAAAVSSFLAAERAPLAALRESWNRLPPDEYLRDGGHYRARRHGCFIQGLLPPRFTAVPHRAHWQPTTYNALHGGIERWFAPLETQVAGSDPWLRLLASLGAMFAQVRPVHSWHIEAHQFRIDASAGIGRPTPEGAHRDGVDFVAVILVGRCHVRGGETRLFEAHGPLGVRFTMQEPWSALLLDDSRVIHETTPIQPDGVPAYRDTLVLTYREQGFQAQSG